MNQEIRIKGKIFAVNKPAGITSHDVVDIIRKKYNTRKVGHAGTLDPFATGVLVIGIGEDTKKLKEIVGQEKEYIATIEFGKSTDTYDVTGKTIEISECWKEISQDSLFMILNSKFVGHIMQQPPTYSAKKVKGRKAYELARKGILVNLRPQKVFVKSIEILDWTPPELKLKIETGPGVYIRSIAQDLGQSLKCPTYLKTLVRIRIGKFTITKSLPV